MQLSNKFKMFLFTLICLLGASQVTAAKFYKWTDKEGSIHYADKEPLGVESAEAVNINTSKTSETVNTIPAFSVQNKTELSPDQQKQKDEDAAKMKEYCDGLTTNIKTLEIGGRIKTVGADGNQRFLSDDEQQEKSKKYQSQFSEKCKS